MNSKLYGLMVSTLAIVIPFGAFSDIVEPFNTSNLNPFVQTHNLPSARSAQVIERNTWQFRLTSEVANNFTSSDQNRETIKIDGETWRNQLTINYGMSERFEVSVAIPYVVHDGGTFDGFIEGWHKTFGLPNGNRNSTERDQLLYQWQADGNMRYNLSNKAQGLGDVRLQLALQLYKEANRHITLISGAKLSTGDADLLLGSDSNDIFAGIYLSQHNFLGKSSLTFHGSIGGVRLGDSHLPRVKDWAGYGSFSLIWKRWQSVALKTQLDFHTALYKSRLSELGQFSGQLSVGGTIAINKKMSLDIGVVEDIITDTSPDVVFHLSIRRHF